MEDGRLLELLQDSPLVDAEPFIWKLPEKIEVFHIENRHPGWFNKNYGDAGAKRPTNTIILGVSDQGLVNKPVSTLSQHALLEALGKRHLAELEIAFEVLDYDIGRQGAEV